MRREDRQVLRVGLLVGLALVVLAGGIFLIGEQQNLFRRKTLYSVRFTNVAGLQAGNPVQLNGVDVGSVKRVLLSPDPAEQRLQVELAVDERYRARIRQDSQASIRTLGLLGDKYIEITAGSTAAPQLPPGGEIQGVETAMLETLLASGEDVMANIGGISRTLATLLDRVERGEGMVGELLRPREADEPGLRESLASVVASAERITAGIEQGQGPLARLLWDKTMAQQLASSLDRLDSLLASAEQGEGLVPGLLHDPTLRQRVETTLVNLETTSTEVRALVDALAQGDGVLARLLTDEAYGTKVTTDLEQILERLNSTLGRIADGDGTVGLLIRDPQIYEAVNDVIVGVNQSKLLRWLIRNRQKAGIRQRYLEELAKSQATKENATAGQPEPDQQLPEKDPSQRP